MKQHVVPRVRNYLKQMYKECANEIAAAGLAAHAPRALARNTGGGGLCTRAQQPPEHVPLEREEVERMSNYPNAIDDASSLYSPADAFSAKPLETITTMPVYASDTTMSVESTGVGFPDEYGILSLSTTS